MQKQGPMFQSSSTLLCCVTYTRKWRTVPNIGNKHEKWEMGLVPNLEKEVTLMIMENGCVLDCDLEIKG